MTVCKEIASQIQTLQEHNMRNVLQKKGCNSETKLAHVEPPLIPLIKKTYNGKSDRDFVKLKFRRDPTSSMADLYEFKMSLFVNGKPGRVFVIYTQLQYDSHSNRDAGY